MISPEEGFLSVKKTLCNALDRFDGNLVFLSSFGAEDMVLTHVISMEGLGIPIHTIDTGRLFQSTYDLIETVRLKYGLNVTFILPSSTRIERLMSSKGPNSFYFSVENRHECCNARKVEPLERAIKGFSAWITGIRSGQTGIRSLMKEIDVDPVHQGVFKVNPLLRWSFSDVMNFLHHFDVPYNRLHDAGFTSIGCEPCTRAIKLGEDERAGRWWWESGVKECGLHLPESEHRIAGRSRGQ